MRQSREILLARILFWRICIRREEEMVYSYAEKEPLEIKRGFDVGLVFDFPFLAVVAVDNGSLGGPAFNVSQSCADDGDCGNWNKKVVDNFSTIHYGLVYRVVCVCTTYGLFTYRFKVKMLDCIISQLNQTLFNCKTVKSDICVQHYYLKIWLMKIYYVLRYYHNHHIFVNKAQTKKINRALAHCCLIN